jgi:hypothetical protein
VKRFRNDRPPSNLRNRLTVVLLASKLPEVRLRRIQMNRTVPMTNGKQSTTSALVQISKHLVVIGAVTLGITLPAISQNPAIQEKLAAVKQAAAENKQKLLQYHEE